MRIIKPRNARQAGDTIVEVLIAIAVVSGVLGITYSIMNRNQMIVRTNQERTEASKLAQQQIEMLKGYIAGHGEPALDTLGIMDAVPFCLYTSSDPGNPGIQPFMLRPQTSYPGPYGVTASDPMTYPAECTPDTNGMFHVFVRRNTMRLEPAGDRCGVGFTITVRWSGLVSEVNETIMAYKSGLFVPIHQHGCGGAT